MKRIQKIFAKLPGFARLDGTDVLGTRALAHLNESQYIDAISVKLITLAYAVVIIATILMWPSDYFVYLASEEYFYSVQIFRTSILSASILGWFVAKLSGYRAKVVWGAYLVAACCTMLMSGYAVARIGDVNSPFFYGVYGAPFSTIVVGFNLWQRFLATMVVVVLFFVGYRIIDPDVFAHSLVVVPLSLLFGWILISILFGQVLFKLIAINYRSARMASSALHEHEVLNQMLEQRVQDQTSRILNLTEHVHHAQQAERVRIARDIHDDIGAMLTGLRWKFFALKSMIVAEGQDVATEDMLSLADECEQGLSDAMLEVRGIIHQIRDHDLSHETLIDAIQVLVGAMVPPGSPVTISVVGESCGLPEEIAQGAYRIVKEAITNALRHASASTIYISLAQTSSSINLTVQDDGVGIEPGAPRGFGTEGMIGRAELLGGSVVMDSAAGKGTTVHISLPLTVPKELERSSKDTP